jgi:Tol biopolymer transport system component
MASAGILAVLLLASLAALVGHFRETPPKVSAVRFQVPLPEKISLGASDFPVVSPNGEYLVVAAGGSPGSTTARILRVRPLNSLSFQDLPGTEGARMPFWSPDSRSVGFFAEGKLKKVDVTGGSPQTICDAPYSQSGAWSPDGTIVFATNSLAGFTGHPLRRVPAAGGEATPLTALDSSRQEFQHGRPFFLPDGRSFLYLAVSSQPEKSGIYAGSLDSKETRRLMTSSSHAAYAPGLSGVGYLMFSRANTLMAQPFDSRKLELSGEPFPIAEQVAEPEFVGSAFSVSGNGVLAYRSGGAGGNTELVWFDRSGKRLQSVGDPAVYSSPALSPDEKRLAVDRLDPKAKSRDIWIFDLVR